MRGLLSIDGKRRLPLFAPGAALLLSLLIGRPGVGQSLDYDNFEGMFGEPVTISATGKPERLSDTPVSMDIITAQDIKRSGARDLASLLRQLPGVQNYFGDTGNQAYAIGAVLLNGREVYLASFSQSFLFSLPVELEEIRQIEVIHGPQSALYGFNAGEGVINIITYDPLEDPITLVRGRAGDGSRRDAAVIASVTLAPAVALRMTLDDDHAQDRDEPGDTAGRVAPLNPDRKDFSASLSAQLGNGDHATAALSHSDVAQRSMIPQIDTLYDLRLISDSIQGGYGSESRFGAISALWSYDSVIVPQATTQQTPWFAINEHVVDGKISDLFKVDPQDSLRLDAEYRLDSLHTSNSVGPIVNSLLSGAAMWDHQFSGDLSLVNALRLTGDTVRQTAASLAGGQAVYHLWTEANNSDLLVKLGQDDSLRASLARGIDLPSQIGIGQLDLSQSGNIKTSILGNNDLRATPSTELRLSWDHHFADQAVNGRISLFHQSSVDLLDLFPIGEISSPTPVCTHLTRLTPAQCLSLSQTAFLSGVAQGGLLRLDHKSRDGLTWDATATIEEIDPHGIDAAADLLPTLGHRQWVEKVTASIGYGWRDWTADLRLFSSSRQQELILFTNPLPHLAISANQKLLLLAPHLAWAMRESLVLDLSADNLWAYRSDAAQRIPVTYYLTVTQSF